MIEVVKNENYTFDDFLRERAMLNDLTNPFLQQVLKDLSESHYPSLLEVLQPFYPKKTSDRCPLDVRTEKVRFFIPKNNFPSNWKG